MWFRKKPRNLLKYFTKDLSTVLGLVLIWRGIWYVLDGIDLYFFDGHHGWLALITIVLGVFILYAPDGDLKEIEKL